jgi:hypothetical protein
MRILLDEEDKKRPRTMPRLLILFGLHDLFQIMPRTIAAMKPNARMVATIFKLALCPIRFLLNSSLIRYRGRMNGQRNCPCGEARTAAP